MKKFKRKLIRPRLCCYPGCRVVVMGGRCDQHALSLEFSQRKREGKKFLNSVAWQRCRSLKLSITPWCERCAVTKPQPVSAVDVHHIKPRHTHPELALTISNLESLCKSCHGVETAVEVRSS